ncbi:MAG: HDOD domain-containing protein [Actinobacteria bacterium]|nr:HDOD domain-containing protein [Actinomycetota bacterium]MCG2800792.1 HDOD domain-containing protein [Cellulomonas sp.]
MTDLHDASSRRWSAPAILRQPIVHPDRSVFAYALRAQAVPPAEGEAPGPDEATTARAIDAEYGLLDLAALSGEHPLLIRATPRLLSGELALAASPIRIVLEVPGELAETPDLAEQLDRLRAAGVHAALGDYTGTPAQDALLERAHIVKVDARSDPTVLAELVVRAHEAGATVVAEHSDNHALIEAARTAQVDLLQGPMFERDGDVLARDFSAGELQCLELMSLLSDDPVDQAAVIGLVAADPMLTVRVLHLVNSSSFGLPREIDSVRQAVVLVGPHHLSALAISSLVGAQPSTVGELWAILSRALACWDLAGADTGYTVGLLSAVAEQRHLAIESLVSRTGVSQEIADALYFHAGQLGSALAAVVAHEANDLMGVLAAGKDPRDVSAAYLAAVPEALSIASSLSVDPG